MAELVAKNPLKCKEFQPVCWIARLGIVERLAGKCDGSCNIITIKQLRQHSPEAIGGGINRQQEWLSEVGMSKSGVIYACFSFLKASLHAGVQSAEERFLDIGRPLSPLSHHGLFTLDVNANKGLLIPLKELLIKTHHPNEGSGLGGRWNVSALHH